MLPRLLVIGAQKAGTQSLTHYLSLHPQTWMCRRELDFFSDDATWARGVEWYAGEIAAPDDPRLVVGETSPSYAMARAFPHTVERVAATLPDVRLVYLLRDPIERMRSHWLHQLAEGARPPRPIDRALLESEDYLACSSYGMQLAAFLEHVPRDRVLLVRTEDLAADPGATLARVARHLGVDPAPEVAAATDHVFATEGRRVPRRGLARFAGTRYGGRLVTRPARARLAAQTRAELARRLAPDLALLCELAGPGFEPWGLR
jgi:hypothetical protein